VWSQDAILHSGNRERVLKEVHRVLRPGGQFIFTDPMQADDCPPGVLEAVLARIHLQSLGSFQFYREALDGLGFEEVRCVPLTEHLVRHYSRVRVELSSRYDEMVRVSTKAYVDRMIEGLGHWIEAGRRGHLSWGILHFRRA
jgi:sarcosine/dimethylglycine N-methyltransferase